MSEMQAQCWICPICHDDHRMPDPYTGNPECDILDLIKLRSSHTDLAKQLAEIQDVDLHSAHERIKDLGIHIREQAEKLAKAEAENARLKHINPIVDQVERLETENARLQEKVELWVCEEEYRNEYKLRAALKERIADLEAENTRLTRVIAQELSENDELGSEYTYVNALREENARLKDELKHSHAMLKHKSDDEIVAKARQLYGPAGFRHVSSMLDKIDRLEQQLKIAKDFIEPIVRSIGQPPFPRAAARRALEQIEALENEKGGEG